MAVDHRVMDLLLMFAWVPLLLLVGHMHRQEGEAYRRLFEEAEEHRRLLLLTCGRGCKTCDWPKCERPA